MTKINPLRIFREYLYLNGSVLGLNRRNLDFIGPYNPFRFRKYANNKLLSKHLLRKNGIPVPKTIAVIRSKEKLNNLDFRALPKSMVIKPAQGTHGRGILVLFGKSKKREGWIGADGNVYTEQDLKEHILNILTGLYSLSGRRDYAFIEERIKVHPTLKPYSYRGIPDIRVIVFNKIPIMAMLRLPTRRSRGTANLHAGAVSVGIDIRYGLTTDGIILKDTAFWADQYERTNIHPDYKYLELSGLKIPYWDKILTYAVKAQKASHLGYVGVDITIDRDRGPLVLEINTRPGLGIQVANGAGLLERLNAVKKVRFASVARAVEVAKALFGGEIEEEVESITGKHIIGLIEDVAVYSPAEVYKKAKKEYKKSPAKLPKPKKEVNVKAKMDTGAFYSSIDLQLALELGFYDLLQFDRLYSTRYSSLDKAREQLTNLRGTYPQGYGSVVGFKLVRSGSGNTVRPLIKVPTLLGDEIKEITYTVANRTHLNYPIIIGRRDLRGFLIDPTIRRVTRRVIY